MLEEHDTTASAEHTAPQEQQSPEGQPAPRRQRQRRSASRPAGPPPVADLFSGAEESVPAPVPAGAETPKAPAVAAIFQVPELPAAPAAPAAPQQGPPPAGEEPSGEGQPKRRSRNRRAKSGEPAAKGEAKGGESTGEKSTAESEAASPSETQASAESAAAVEESAAQPQEGAPQSSTKKRRRRKRGSGGDAEGGPEEPNTVTKVRAPRESEPAEKVTGVKGSTRLEAKKQRRRDGREAGRRRAPILSEAEFLARREAVDRAMVVRQLEDVTQIAVLEDGVLVEHYVTKETGAPATMVGNVYLGRVQNVLPSMEAAFVDIGRGRNAVLYAGEVNWDAAGLDGQPKRIEFALKSGDPVLVQVTKDPIGHKGARLTSQVSLPGRYLVFVPDGSMTGISRKLPDTERSRLRSILKRIVPEDVGVIVRTAAEGATEEELQRDVTRLTKAWEDIQRKAGSASPPHLLHAEPDLAIRVVRDLFNEDFRSMEVSGDRAWKQVKQYVDAVAPDLSDRVGKWTGSEDVFASRRIDEQLAKALDRKVWLPSGGSLIIEHTEAMTVIDVNTGKFTGQGGDLEETVTQNNLEAAEEIVRQVRLRDIGGIIVIDFIDMVLESNRDLVLRRLVECLGRDRTKHQVTEITSLGLAQMTRKRIGGGLLETFSEPCEACNGRGVRIHFEPHGAPASWRRKPVKPVGAHDPIETMLRGAAESEGGTAVEATESTEAHPLVEAELRAEASPVADAEPGAAEESAAADVQESGTAEDQTALTAPGAAHVETEAAQSDEGIAPEQPVAAAQPLELVIAAYGADAGAEDGEVEATGAAPSGGEVAREGEVTGEVTGGGEVPTEGEVSGVGAGEGEVSSEGAFPTGGEGAGEGEVPTESSGLAAPDDAVARQADASEDGGAAGAESAAAGEAEHRPV